MPVHAEDVYEDLDEADDEDIEDAILGEDDLSERRRRRGGRNGGRNGYNKPRIEKSFATQAQLQQVSDRIAKDIRALDASVRSVQSAARRNQGSLNQSMQMMALLPLLTKKTATVTATGALPAGTNVVIDDNDSLTTMLPLMMMMSMPGMSSSTNGQGQSQGGMDPMMMMMMVLVISQGNNKSGAS